VVYFFGGHPVYKRVTTECKVDSYDIYTGESNKISHIVLTARLAIHLCVIYEHLSYFIR